MHSEDGVIWQCNTKGLIKIPYDSIIDRSGAQALIPIETSREIWQGAVEDSVVMTYARRGQNMSSKQRTVPVLESLPTAYFVNGDTGLKQTTEMDWGKKEMVAEELAVIVPIPEAVLDDADYDIWGEVKPRISEAMGVAIDQAVSYGTNAPASWPDDLLAGATAAGQTISYAAAKAGNPAGTPPVASKDMFDIILGEDGIISLLEASGYAPNGHAAAMLMRGRLRGLRNSGGAPIFGTDMQTAGRYLLDGEPIYFPRNGALDPAQSLMISADWTKVIYAIRQDITYKMLDQAVIQDATGAIVYNLAQQDMVALRVVMRLGWQVANPISRLAPTEASRFPVAFLVP